ncbi:MAG: molybdopterin oxidoreductase family protein, partial [Pseudomonadota bacterium]
LYMANMGWNSSMNVKASLEHLTRTDPETGEYVIPRIIYSDAYYSETVPYADLILPDTTYLERWDCISLLDRPISEPDGPADAIRQPVVQPDRDVRPFQDVLIELGARLGLPGFSNEDGTPKYPGGYPDYIVNHERKEGIGPLAGWRGKDGSETGTGAPNPDQLQRYIENGCFHQHHLADSQRFYRHANLDYMKWATKMGFRLTSNPVVFQLYLEPMQKFRLAAKGRGSLIVPHPHRKRIETYFDPLPVWYMPFEEALAGEEEYPLHAVTQRPMAMYHSWGSQNAWLRQIHGRNWMYVNTDKGRELGLTDGDWIWITSPHGRVKAQAKLMDGVNRDTIWTWNAIGKRPGAWNLDPDAPEASKGFLLNHVISELLPERGGGYRYSNSDPVTGQAAWYDLRVKIEKADPEPLARTEPQFEPQKRASGLRRAPDDVAFTGRRKKR